MRKKGHRNAHKEMGIFTRSKKESCLKNAPGCSSGVNKRGRKAKEQSVVLLSGSFAPLSRCHVRRRSRANRRSLDEKKKKTQTRLRELWRLGGENHTAVPPREKRLSCLRRLTAQTTAHCALEVCRASTWRRAAPFYYESEGGVCVCVRACTCTCVCVWGGVSAARRSWVGGGGGGGSWSVPEAQASKHTFERRARIFVLLWEN